MRERTFFLRRKEILDPPNDDTEPLLPIDKFDRLLIDIDSIQINMEGDYDSGTGIIRKEFGIETFSVLTERVKKFLGISDNCSEISGLRFSLYHSGEDNSWVAISNGLNRLKITLDTSKHSCEPQLQSKVMGKWVALPDALHPLPDIEQIVRVLKESIN